MTIETLDCNRLQSFPVRAIGWIGCGSASSVPVDAPRGAHEIKNAKGAEAAVDITIYADKSELGRAAAAEGAEAIRRAITAEGKANVVLATGASQFEMLGALVAADIDWSRVHAFHLDEYVGIDAAHAASFRRYLKERFLDQIGSIGQFEMIAGDAPDIAAEIERLNGSIGGREIHVCFAGIGENCHLAFNDPPADFETTDPYILVQLDEACRRQQLGEGWFENFEAVPVRAISMSIHQIMASQRLVLSVSDARKAEAVRAVVEGSISPQHPATIVQRHPAATLHLDEAAASRLSARPAP